ncbi:related to MED7-member of RNA Polymerase II transcriptional regulation mediator complex [Ramularia collo-cygni]|uniref:Mediator of RNA polymerase II transcription subunit 7 n=1 Tax=Ramularia collo-cygni TaxID=112498 RepID=A0A2D3UW30_9PEZI|nr:related to MED7-member of RNA Polymerase II transcriptional regulation mediator complex [Ramularia collo-cygni]CZT17290.1 related to MED7-member of RNA Polymerase II transcriptional regulation mediator complex [Ramularia collo-cygni]
MGEPQVMAAPFPTPPPFWKHFTKQNVARAKQLRDGETIDSELQYLIPPEPPSDGKYHSFGVPINLHEEPATLESAGIDQLYPTHPDVRLNPQPHLISLARSLLTTFLSLTGTLSQNPELYEETVTDLQTITYNMHDLINQYRPHQARESLILIMEERVERMKAENQAIDESKEKLAKLLQGIQEGALAQSVTESSSAAEKTIAEDVATQKRRARQQAAWVALEREMG